MPQTTGLSPAQFSMGRRLRTHLDLLHPDSSSPKAQRKQLSLTTGRSPRVFKEGHKLFAKSFHGLEQWTPVTVSKVCGPLSYQVKTSNDTSSATCGPLMNSLYWWFCWTSWRVWWLDDDVWPIFNCQLQPRDIILNVHWSHFSTSFNPDQDSYRWIFPF